MIDIPIEELKNTKKIEVLCEKSKSPIFITKDGKRDLAIMSIGCFEDLFYEAYVDMMIGKGLDDVKAGRVIDGNIVLEKIKKKYGF